MLVWRVLLFVRLRTSTRTWRNCQRKRNDRDKGFSRHSHKLGAQQLRGRSRQLRELHAGDPVRVTFQLLDYDLKRMHYFEQLFHAEAGWLSATSENMVLHVDMVARKTAPFPDFIAAQLQRMKAAHANLPAPDGVGRRIAMPEKA